MLTGCFNHAPPDALAIVEAFYHPTGVKQPKYLPHLKPSHY